MIPVLTSSRRAPLHLDGLHNRPECLLAKGKEAKDLLAVGEAADQRGRLSGRGLEGIRQFHRLGQVALPLLDNRLCVFRKPQEQIERAGSSLASDRMLSHRLKPGIGLGERLNTLEGLKGVGSSQRLPDGTSRTDADRQRAIPCGRLREALGPDEVLMQPGNDLSVGQILNRREHRIQVLKPGTEGHTGRSEGGDLVV